MIDLKTLRDWFIIFMILLFLPKDNSLTKLDMRPEDWYGELQIPVGTQLFIVAKNSGAEKVDLSLAGKSQIISIQSEREEGALSHDPSNGLPESIMVITAERKPENAGTRTAWLDNKRYFKPGRLSILTQSDLYYGYLLVGFLVGGFMVLGFLIARYGVEEKLEPQDK